MQAIFLPGIKLMNALTFPRKFIVLGGLSLSSLLIVLIFFMIHMSETINTSNQQLEGLKQVQATSLLIQSIQKHRGLSAGEIAGAGGITEKRIAINQQIKEYFTAVNGSVPKEVQQSKDWLTINDRWKYLDNKGVTLGLNSSFDSHTKLLQRLFTFQRNLADYYQLPLVNDIDSYYLTNASLYSLPITLELLGQVRALGTSYLVNKNEADKKKINKLLSKVDIPLHVFKENINKLENVMTPDGMNITKTGLVFAQTINRHIHFTSNNVLPNDSHLDPVNFYERSSDVIDEGFYFLKVTLASTLNDLLNRRVEKANNQLFLSLSFSIMLFALVLYFLVAIYLSTRKSINTLTDATHAFSNGDLDQRVVISTSDELKHIASGFNEMAEGLQNILSEKLAISDQLRAVIDNSPIGIWFSGINGEYYFVNKTFCDLVNIKEEQFLAINSSSLPELLGVEIATHCITSDQSALQQDFPHISYETISTQDGETHTLEITKVKLKDKQGKVLGLIGISQDITDKQKKEDELKLADMIYQNSREAMMITDQNNKIIAINPALSAITGYSDEELIGLDPKILSSGKQTPSFYQDMWEEIRLTGGWEGEILNTKKNGSHYPEWISINTIYDDYGDVFRRIALFSDITEKKKADELILRQANYDSLTRLPNRRMFNDRLEQEVKKSHRAKLPLALIFLDLDNFKIINDTQGHDNGDALLIEAGKRISDCVRETDTVARIGGDEFTVILSELNDLHHVETISQKILDALSQPFWISEIQVYISASLGITLYPSDASTALELLKNADQAMYLAKELGRNRFCYFTSSMQEQAQYRLELLNDLRQATSLNQLEVYYQPIVELDTGKIHKAEALLRWKHPTRGMISPAEFIPLAEDFGLIVGIGDWVFKQTVQQIQICKQQFGINVQISINKSPVQFRESDNHMNWINYLSENQLSGKDIVIEITEGLLMDDSESILKQLHQFRDAGIEVSMDDFGTGYSSLSYLKKFDIDYLKIDQSFTKNISPDSEDMVLSEAIIIMAHKLGLKVIAEGIETDEQRKLLLNAGCDYGQGYYFSRPVPEQEFIALLQANK